MLGLGAIGLAIGLLGILIVSLVYTGYVAFTQTRVELEFRIDPALVNPEDVRSGNFRSIVRQAIFEQFPEVTNRRQQTQLARLLSPGAEWIVRDYVVAHPEVIGQTIKLMVPVADPYDQLNKGILSRDVRSLSGGSTMKPFAGSTPWKQRGLIHTTIAWELFVNADSRFPEMAGLRRRNCRFFPDASCVFS